MRGGDETFAMLRLALAFWFAGVVHSRTFSRCQLAKELAHVHRVPTEQIATWVCIAEHESNFDTTAVGRLNGDGSADHGIFQISDKYWCATGGGNACNIDCLSLLDDDISDDWKCARRIHRQHQHLSGDGFTAWAVYNSHCRSPQHYIEGCFDDENEIARSYLRFTHPEEIHHSLMPFNQHGFGHIGMPTFDPHHHHAHSPISARVTTLASPVITPFTSVSPSVVITQRPAVHSVPQSLIPVTQPVTVIPTTTSRPGYSELAVTPSTFLRPSIENRLPGSTYTTTLKPAELNSPIQARTYGFNPILVGYTGQGALNPLIPYQSPFPGFGQAKPFIVNGMAVQGQNSQSQQYNQPQRPSYSQTQRPIYNQPQRPSYIQRPQPYRPPYGQIQQPSYTQTQRPGFLRPQPGQRPWSIWGKSEESTGLLQHESIDHSSSRSYDAQHMAYTKTTVVPPHSFNENQYQTPSYNFPNQGHHHTHGLAYGRALQTSSPCMSAECLLRESGFQSTSTVSPSEPSYSPSYSTTTMYPPRLF